MDIEQIDIEDRALDYIAKAGDGSMRDALSILDECVSFFHDKKITYEDILSILGAVDETLFTNLFSKIQNADSKGAIDLIETVVRQGQELGQFVLDFTWYLRNLLLVKNMPNALDVIDVSKEKGIGNKDTVDGNHMTDLGTAHFSARLLKYLKR